MDYTLHLDKLHDLMEGLKLAQSDALDVSEQKLAIIGEMYVTATQAMNMAVQMGSWIMVCMGLLTSVVLALMFGMLWTRA